MKKETDLLALVQSRGIELNKHGSKDWKGLCPFHGDRGHPTSSSRRKKDCGIAWRAGKRAIRSSSSSTTMASASVTPSRCLADGSKTAYAARPQMSNCTIPVLSCPLDPEADDAALLQQVADITRNGWGHAGGAGLPASRGSTATTSSAAINSALPTGHWACGCPMPTTKPGNFCARG